MSGTSLTPSQQVCMELSVLRWAGRELPLSFALHSPVPIRGVGKDHHSPAQYRTAIVDAGIQHTLNKCRKHNLLTDQWTTAPSKHATTRRPSHSESLRRLWLAGAFT